MTENKVIPEAAVEAACQLRHGHPDPDYVCLSVAGHK